MIQIKKYNSLKEAFSAGKAGMVVQKMGNILSKRIKEPIVFSEVPLMYENDYGTFAGYLGSISNGRLFLKINFKLTTSDTITSVDFYDKDVSSPLYTVDMDGLNIVQIVNAITEELIEDGEVDDSLLEGKVRVNRFKLKERGRPSKPTEDYIYVIDKWVEQEPSVLKDLQNKALSEVFSNSFMKWVSDKPRYKEEMKYYFFVKVVKMFLVGRGLSNKTFRKRKKGSKERQVTDPIMEAQFEEIVESISWEEKFEFLRGSVAQMVQGKLQSIYLYGSPGSGKSFEVIDALEREKANYKVYKGGFKGTSEAVRVLYNNRFDTVLVFDDADSILKNKDQVNIFKAALENKPSREITWVDLGSKKSMEDVPPKFDFDSSVIFISNEPQKDSAIASRSFVIEITLSNEEMNNKIEKTLSEFRPEVDIKKKKIALEYAKEISPGVKSIDYRIMDNILIAMDISPGNWKKMVLLLLQSAD